MRCRRPFIPTIAVAALSLLAAGCGSGSATTAGTTTQSSAHAYSRCMHSHGVPSFPDPDASGDIPKVKVVPLAGSPQFQVAQRSCQHLFSGRQESAQQKRTRLADALAFARCMRARGFPNFPDPSNSGVLSPQMVTAAGIDLHGPQLLRTGLACVPVTHGLLTRAAIERAVNGG